MFPNPQQSGTLKRMPPVIADEYTIWLEPRADIKKEMFHFIHDFARRAGTPLFEPHVTLLPGLQGKEDDLIVATQILAAASGPVPIHLLGSRRGELYHKCLYIECEKSKELTELHQKGEKAFSVSSAFHPHLSLAYGLSDEMLKDAFIAEFPYQNIPLVAETVSLWHARGLPHEWRRVATFPL